jgi:uncharacterized protein YeaO (DUF488 family)
VDIMTAIHIKRAYASPSESDGARILVDRLWPRGLSRKAAHVDVWMKDVAPSDGLRRSFAHDAAKWPEFRRRYLAELKGNPAFEELQAILRPHHRATLIFGAKDPERNNAAVLREALARAGTT